MLVLWFLFRGCAWNLQNSNGLRGDCRLNTIGEFLGLYYARDNRGRVDKWVCYNRYLAFLDSKKLRRVSLQEFHRELKTEGCYLLRTTLVGHAHRSVQLITGLCELPSSARAQEPQAVVSVQPSASVTAVSEQESSPNTTVSVVSTPVVPLIIRGVTESRTPPPADPASVSPSSPLRPSSVERFVLIKINGRYYRQRVQ